MKKNFKEVTVISLTENLGFAGGYNQGLKKINSKYFIIVNSDIEVTKNWIPPLIEVLKNNSNIVAVQPKILSYSEKNKFEHAGAAGGFIDKLGYTFCKGRIFESTEIDEGQYDEYSEIFWASGACMAIKAQDFNDVGGFDESFFAHMEEIDLCWRLKNLGKNIFYTSDSTVFHVGGGTLNYNSPKKTFLNYRNNLWMIHKNYKGKVPLFIFILFRIKLDQISGVKLLISGDFKNYFAILKAHFSYVINIKQLQTKRNNIAASKFNSLAGYCEKSIIWNYFFLNNKKYSDISINK